MNAKLTKQLNERTEIMDELKKEYKKTYAANNTDRMTIISKLMRAQNKIIEILIEEIATREMKK